MRESWLLLIVVVLVTIFAAGSAKGQQQEKQQAQQAEQDQQKPSQCSTCDCHHFPIVSECFPCCGVATGKIVSATDTKVVLSQKERNGSFVVKKFNLKSGTKRNADLKKGFPATIYYSKEGDFASRIDMLEALPGLLIPGQEPDPPLPVACQGKVPTDALKVFVGNSLGSTPSDEVTVLRINGIDVVSLRRTSEGIAIDAKVFSQSGAVQAQIVDNHLYINPHSLFRIAIPNRHSFIVYDPDKIKVLEVRYLNKHSVRLEGNWKPPGFDPVEITRDKINVAGYEFTANCIRSTRVLFALQ